jgi:hypothetical protein
MAGESLIFWNGCTRSGIAPNNPADVPLVVEQITIIVRPFAVWAMLGRTFKDEHRHRTPQRGHEGGLFYNLLAVRLPAAARRS